MRRQSLSGVRAKVKVDKIIVDEIRCHCTATIEFYPVKWTGQPGIQTAGQLGVLNLTPERLLWDFHAGGSD